MLQYLQEALLDRKYLLRLVNGVQRPFIRALNLSLCESGFRFGESRPVALR
jgi:hypothetical protein